MNNYNKTELLLDGLDIDGLYLEDVFSVWEQFDRIGNKYFTVFLINNSRITVTATEANTALLYKNAHGVVEFVVTPNGVLERAVKTTPNSVNATPEELSNS